MPLDEDFLKEIDEAADESLAETHGQEEEDLDDGRPDESGIRGEGQRASGNGGEGDPEGENAEVSAGTDKGDSGGVESEAAEGLGSEINGGDGASKGTLRERLDAAGDGETIEVSNEELAELSKQGQQEPTVSDDLLTRALEAGIPLREARKFPSEELLTSAVEAIERVKEPNKKDEEEADPLANLPELDPEVVDPAVIEYFNAMKEVIKLQQERIQSQKATASQSDVEANARQAAQLEVWFDERCAALDLEKTLGNGKYNALVQGSAERVSRDKLINQISVLMAGYEQSNQAVPPQDEIFAQAAKLALGDEIAARKEAKLKYALKKRSGTHTRRAGSSGKGKASSEESADAAAIKMLEEKFGA